eukprot:2379522-Pyramimonas_sp.AAC.1
MAHPGGTSQTVLRGHSNSARHSPGRTGCGLEPPSRRRPLARRPAHRPPAIISRRMLHINRRFANKRLACCLLRIDASEFW